MSHQGEGSSRQKDPNESEEDTRLLNQAYVAVERYAKRESAFREFNVLKYKFMASFGAEHKELFEETERCHLHLYRRTFFSISLLAQHQTSIGT
jgi:hypothetical protein